MTKKVTKTTNNARSGNSALPKGATRRSLLAGGVAAAILTALSPRNGARAADKNTLTIGTVTLGSGLGLTWLVTGDSVFLPSLAEDSLIRMDEKGALVSGLAKEFKTSPDGRVVTLVLQKGVKFHGDNGELTSADVRFAFEKMITGNAPATIAPNLKAAIQSIETPDDYTVVLNIKPGHETFDFLGNISHEYPRFQITSAKYVAKVGEQEAARKWIGTGSWELTSFTSGDNARFKAVKNHWRKTPIYDELIVKEVPDPSTQKLMLEAGDLDIIPCSADSVDELRKAGFKIISSIGHPLHIFFGGLYLPSRPTFNPKLPWVADPADKDAWERARLVRLAMNHAIDTTTIFKTIMGGNGEQTAVPLMLPSNPGYDPAWKPYAYDVDRAKDLLKQADYAKGFNLTVRQYRLAGRDAMWDIAAALPGYLQKVGIIATLQPVDYTAVQAPDQRGRKLSALGVYGVYKQEALTAWSLNTPSTASANHLPEHPWLDERIATGLKTFDVAARMKITHEIGQWFIDNAASIPIGSQSVTYAVNPDVVDQWPLPPAVTAPLVNTEMVSRK